MTRATITLPEELQTAFDDYAARQPEPPDLTEVLETALREYLQRQGEEDDDVYRPFRITPARIGSGRTDISANHDAYLADDIHRDSFGQR